MGAVEQQVSASTLLPLCVLLPAVFEVHLRLFSLCEGAVAAFLLHLSQDKSSYLPEGSGCVICVDPDLPCTNIFEHCYLEVNSK